METLASFNWYQITGEGILFISALVLILGEVFLKKPQSAKLLIFALIAMFVALAGETWSMYSQYGTTTSIISSDTTFGIFVIICAILTALLSVQYHSKGGKSLGEYLAVLMISAASLSIFVRANNLMLAFVALESATVAFYAMSAWNRDNAPSLEAGVKYLVAAGASGAIFLMAIAFIYGAGLSTSADYLNIANFADGVSNKLFLVGLLFLACGVFFKISAFPFQFWSPDVYQGSPTPTSAFLAVASKGAGVVFLIKICAVLSSAPNEIVEKAVLFLGVVAALTIIVGNLSGISELKTKRLMAFSGISNAGYLLVLATATLKLGSDNAEGIVYFYLLAYMFATYGVFFVVNRFSNIDDSQQNFSDYRGMRLRSPLSLTTLIVGLSSLAGIPPTAGFFGKLLILFFAWNAQLYWLVGVMIAGSTISIYYYFGWIRAAIAPAEGSEIPLTEASSTSATMIALTVATLLFSVVIIAGI